MDGESQKIFTNHFWFPVLNRQDGGGRGGLGFGVVVGGGSRCFCCCCGWFVLSKICSVPGLIERTFDQTNS